MCGIDSETEKIRELRNRHGLGLPIGANHYRAYVGAPELYDCIAAMAFNLLTCLGLRQHHRLLDIGCGSLRIGRLLIPYLNRGNYTGIEPNEWLVTAGIKEELGADMTRIKAPTFVFSSDPAEVPRKHDVDFALAQSIFSHAPKQLIQAWLDSSHEWMAPTGALVATYFQGSSDHDGKEWVYPGITYYRATTIATCAESSGLRCVHLNWRHPKGQTWILLARKDFDISWIRDGNLGWNAVVDRICPHP